MTQAKEERTKKKTRFMEAKKGLCLKKAHLGRIGARLLLFWLTFAAAAAAAHLAAAVQPHDKFYSKLNYICTFDTRQTS